MSPPSRACRSSPPRCRSAPELCTGKISLPAHASGPCGGEPVAAALSLYRAWGNARFAGSLTGYCGDRFFGVQAAMLRLSGDLGRD